MSASSNVFSVTSVILQETNWYKLRTLPFTSYTPQNDSVSFSTGASPVLDLHPSLNFGQPSLSVNSGTACVTVALGPEASFSIEPGGGGAPLLSIGGEIDIPKFETCASEANSEWAISQSSHELGAVKTNIIQTLTNTVTQMAHLLRPSSFGPM